MRLIFGMLLGAALLTAGAYFHDKFATAPVAGRAQASETRPMVNWDVVGTNWDAVVVRVQEGWAALKARIDRV